MIWKERSAVVPRRPRDDVRRILGEVGVEVDRVRVVEALAGVVVRGVDQDRVVRS